MLNGQLQDNNSPELVEQVKGYLRNIGVELLPDMDTPIVLLHEADGTQKAIAAVSRISDTLTEDTLRDFVQKQKYTRAALYQVIERTFCANSIVNPETLEVTKMEEPQLSKKYIIRGYFE